MRAEGRPSITDVIAYRAFNELIGIDFLFERALVCTYTPEHRPCYE